ncbi:IRF3 factor, partial [Steatornis caripensis]|nr:IRF3 factor [Steatornis caripensis]
QAWAKASGRYEGCPEDPAKWKTNFRCALSSTRMFMLLEDHSKCGDDPHKVFAVVPGEPCPTGGPSRGRLSRGLSRSCETSHTLSLLSGSTDPARPLMLGDVEALQWVLQQCDISPRHLGPPTPSWAPAGKTDPACQVQVGCCCACPKPKQPPTALHLDLRCRRCLSAAAGAVPLPCHMLEGTVPVPSPGEAMLLAPAASPVPPPPPPEDNTGVIIPILDVSIYYRGKLFHQEEVGGGRCLLAYQPSDPAVALRPGRLVRFPSPAELADSKQRRFTEELLGGTGLQLEQRACKLFATRLKKCKVFWALSQQLEGIGDPPPNQLCRDQETPIFDFNEFCTELRDFRNGQRQRSPDFTIYLCFGQSFNAKPKESKLILVKLVPKFCEYWYEQVLREGASSLDSGTVSLQLSNSFDLFELIEQCDMQLD